jgi:hypothetical protein
MRVLDRLLDVENARGSVTDASVSTSAAIAQAKIAGLVSDLAAKVGTSDSRLSDARTPLAGSVTNASVAANLGDLMRLWVQPGVQISLPFGFSGAARNTPDTSEDKVLYLPICPSSS